MARTKGPLFSLDASGTLAESMVFSKWRGRTYVRRHVVPANPNTGLQRGMRSIVRFISQDFTNLSSAQADSWLPEADVDNITRLNAQIRVAGDRGRRNLGWIRDRNASALGTIDAPTGVTVTAQPGALNITWTRPVSNQGDYSAAVYLRTTTGLTGDISELRRIVDVTTVDVTITGLPAGVEQFVVVRETSAAGELGTVSSEASGTPT